MMRSIIALLVISVTLERLVCRNTGDRNQTGLQMGPETLLKLFLGLFFPVVGKELFWPRIFLPDLLFISNSVVTPEIAMNSGNGGAVPYAAESFKLAQF